MLHLHWLEIAASKTALETSWSPAWSSLIPAYFPPFFPPWLHKHRGFLSSDAKLRRLKSSRSFSTSKEVKKVLDNSMLLVKRGFSSVWMTNNGFDLLSLTARYLQIYLLESHFSWHSHLACFSGTHMEEASEEAIARTSEEKIVKLEFSNISKNFAQKSCSSHPRIQIDGFFFTGYMFTTFKTS